MCICGSSEIPVTEGDLVNSSSYGRAKAVRDESQGEVKIVRFSL